MCSRLVLTLKCERPEEFDKVKFKLVSNRHLATRGRSIHIDRHIRSRTSMFTWGDCSSIRYVVFNNSYSSYNTVADVMEALIGAVAYHRSHEEAIRATGYICGDDENQTNTTLAAYIRGYQPESVYCHIKDDMMILEAEKLYIAELERYQS